MEVCIISSNNNAVKDSKKQILEVIYEARQEMLDIENYFNNVTERALIDEAIFRLNAIKIKYVYLVKQAQNKGITIRDRNLFI